MITGSGRYYLYTAQKMRVTIIVRKLNESVFMAITHSEFQSKLTSLKAWDIPNPNELMLEVLGYAAKDPSFMTTMVDDLASSAGYLAEKLNSLSTPVANKVIAHFKKDIVTKKVIEGPYVAYLANTLRDDQVFYEFCSVFQDSIRTNGIYFDETIETLLSLKSLERLEYFCNMFQKSIDKKGIDEHWLSKILKALYEKLTGKEQKEWYAAERILKERYFKIFAESINMLEPDDFTKLLLSLPSQIQEIIYDTDCFEKFIAEATASINSFCNVINGYYRGYDSHPRELDVLLYRSFDRLVLLFDSDQKIISLIQQAPKKSKRQLTKKVIQPYLLPKLHMDEEHVSFWQSEDGVLPDKIQAMCKIIEISLWRPTLRREDLDDCHADALLVKLNEIRLKKANTNFVSRLFSQKKQLTPQEEILYTEPDLMRAIVKLDHLNAKEVSPRGPQQP